MAVRKICYVISALIIVGSIAAEAVHGLNLAVDFTGGVVIEAAYTGAANLDGTRTALKSAGYSEVTVQNRVVETCWYASRRLVTKNRRMR
jgi:preprotein translocase subunit SecF